MRKYKWLVFLIVDILVLQCFVLGYLARWIDPRWFWWPQLYAIALPVLSVLVLFLTFPLIPYKKWGMLAIHLFCLVLALIRFSPLGANKPPESATAEGLRVGSYNMGRFDSSPRHMLPQTFSEVIQGLQPDVLGLQEFLIRYRGSPVEVRNLPEVASVLEEKGFQIIASEYHMGANTAKPVFTNTARLEMVRNEKITIARGVGRVMNVDRVQVRWEGRDAVIYNVHLHTFGERKPWTESGLAPLNPAFWRLFLTQYRDAFRSRAWQADILRELLDKETDPLIVLGDFNSTPHNWAFHRLASQYRDVFREAGNPYAASFHSRFPLVRIDHVLVSEEWQVLDAEILPLSYSDHRPVLVTLAWK